MDDALEDLKSDIRECAGTIAILREGLRQLLGTSSVPMAAHLTNQVIRKSRPMAGQVHHLTRSYSDCGRVPRGVG